MIRFNRSGVVALSTTALALVASAFLAACSGAGSSANGVLPGSVGPNQHSSGSAQPDTVHNIYGGGSTLASLLYRQWFDCYGVAMSPDAQGCNGGVAINPNALYYYAGVGSGAGQLAFLSQSSSTVAPSSSPIFCPGGVTTCYPYPSWHFSGSDATLSAAQISCYQVGGPCGSGGANVPAAQPARGQFVQVPTLATAITLMYNPTGQTVPAGGLQLSRETYCGVWEGHITNWGDPKITADNGGTQVSTQAIVRVTRSDGSGTTFLFTNHLNTACQGLSDPANDWTGGVGTTVTWPGAATTTGSGSGGVVSAVTSNAGAIGYVGPSFVAPVVSGGLPTAKLQNQYAIDHSISEFIGPTIAATLKAEKSVTPPTNTDPFDLAILFPNPANNNAYPIAGFTWIEAYQCYGSGGGANNVKLLLKWYAQTGTNTLPDQMLSAQGLAPLSTAFKNRVRSIANSIVTGPRAGVCTI